MSSIPHLSNLYNDGWWGFIVIVIMIILSGVMLSNSFQIPQSTNQKLVVNLKILKLQATGSEVVLGLVIYLLVTFLTGLFGGKELTTFINCQFGLTFSQFNSICILGGVLSLIVSAVVFFIKNLPVIRDSKNLNNQELYEAQLKKLSASRSQGEKRE